MGRVFPGWTSAKLGLMFLLKDTTQWRQWGSNPRPFGLKSNTLPLSHCAPWNIYFIIWNKTLNPLFAAVFSLMPTMVKEVLKANLSVHSLFFIYAWMEIYFLQNYSLLQLITDVTFYKLRHKSLWRQTWYRAASYLKEILCKTWFCCKIKKNRLIHSNLVTTCSSRSN